METEIECPICTYVQDISKKASKAKYPMFDTKCDGCKGKITVLMPIFGGNTKVWETECPPNVDRLETETPFRVNGEII